MHIYCYKKCDKVVWEGGELTRSNLWTLTSFGKTVWQIGNSV